MAVTKGHGNPNWTEEETILALSLYQKHGYRKISKSHPDVLTLSELLNKNPQHPLETRKSSFRNPDGVAFKVSNIHAARTKTGLTNISNLDARVWTEYGGRVDEVSRLSNEIITTILESNEKQKKAGEQKFYAEGELKLVTHRFHERNSNLRPAVIAERLKNGRLKCEICSVPPRFSEPPLYLSEFEIHHIRPLSERQRAEETQLEDVILVCSNCHRLTHALIRAGGEWYSLESLRVKLV